MKYYLFISIFLSQLSLADSLQQGQVEIDKENYAKAYEILLPLAEQNQEQAQYMVGKILADGLIADKPVSEGVAWLEKAVNNRHMSAAHTLGRMYLSGFGVPLDTEKGAYYMTLAEEFRPPEEPASDCD